MKIFIILSTILLVFSLPLYSAWEPVGSVHRVSHHLVLSNSDENILAVCTTDTLFISRDGGERFTPLGHFNHAAFYPNSSDTIVASFGWGTRSDAMYLSTDGGGSFEFLDWVRHPKFVAINPDTASIWYIASEWGVVKTTNAGADFYQINEGIPEGERDLFHIDVSPAATSVIWTVGYPVYGSTDGGARWERFEEPFALDYYSPLSVTSSPTDPEVAYVATWGGVVRTTNSGSDWITPTTPLVDARKVAISPDEPEILYACSGANGVFRSTDAGESWSEFNDSLTETEIVDIAIQKPTGKLFALSSHGDIFVWQEETEELSLTFSLDSTSYYFGDSIFSTTKLTSLVDSLLYIDEPTIIFANLYFIIISPLGDTVLPTYPVAPGIPETIPISTGETITADFELFNNFDFDTVYGGYNAKACYISGYNIAGATPFWEGTLESEWVRFSLLPPTGITEPEGKPNFSLGISPNPFNSSCQISVFSPEGTKANLEIFNINGEKVDEKAVSISSGGNIIIWEPNALPSGVYVIRMHAGKELLTRKLLLLR